MSNFMTLIILIDRAKACKLPSSNRQNREEVWRDTPIIQASAGNLEMVAEYESQEKHQKCHKRFQQRIRFCRDSWSLLSRGEIS